MAITYSSFTKSPFALSETSTEIHFKFILINAIPGLRYSVINGTLWVPMDFASVAVYCGTSTDEYTRI
jgi:hypothetical protein